MSSTEASVRTVIVNAIQAITVKDLGFDEPGTGVFAFLVDYADAAKRSSYLQNSCGGKKLTRAIGVQVLSENEKIKDGPAGGLCRYFRVYQAHVRMYYQLRNGDDFNLMVDHARAIRGAVKTLGINFSQTVDYIEEVQPLSVEITDGLSDRMLIGSIVYRLNSQSPDF